MTWDDKYRRERFSRAGLGHAAEVASVQEVRRELEPGTGVLEAGAGTGRLSVYLATAFDVRAVGVDSAEEAVSLGRELAEAQPSLTGSVEFVQGDLYSLPFGDAAFGVVFSDSVIEHLDRPAAALSEMKRVLRPGGVLVVSTPNRWRPDGWDLYKRLAKPPYPQTSFSPPDLRRLVEESGLRFDRYFGEELLLRRNLGLLRSRVRPAMRTSEAGLRQSSARDLRRKRLELHLKPVLAAVLPSWLHVNIGVVARNQ